jgi:hypothetical protein
MRMFAGPDVGFKRTSVCIVDQTGKIVWRGLWTPIRKCCRGVATLAAEFAKVGLESGSSSP